MKILVTGATGFIGSNLCHTLFNRGFKVKAFVRNKKKALELLPSGIELSIGDIRNKNSVIKALEGCSHCVHSAALLEAAQKSESEMHEVNVVGTQNILESSVKVKLTRLIHISSVGIYGSSGKGIISEESDLKPVDTYSRNKLVAEKYVRRFMNNGLNTVILKPTIVYGPRDTHSSIFQLFKAIKSNKFFLIGNKDIYFHTAYVDNVVGGIIQSLDTKNTNEDYILGDYPPPSLTELAQEIAQSLDTNLPSFRIPLSAALLAGISGSILKRVGIPFPLTLSRVAFMTQNRKYSIDKAKRLLGYEPKTTLKEGVIKTVLWYKKENYL